jgi:hypothetical protein
MFDALTLGFPGKPACTGQRRDDQAGRFAGRDVGSLADLPRDHGSDKSGMTGRTFASRHTAMGLITGSAAIAVMSGVIAVLQQFVDPRGLSVLYLFAIFPVAIGWGFGPPGSSPSRRS